MKKLLLLLLPISCFAQGIITTVAGNDAIFADDGKAAVSAALSAPQALVLDNAGNVLIADTALNMVLKVDSKGILTVVAGNGLHRFAGDGGPARAASLAFPASLAVDAAGNLFIAELENCSIRRVGADGNISTVAGGNGCGFAGDGGLATKAQINGPGGIAVDSGGNLYIAEGINNRIQKVNAAGIISTIAGNGQQNNGGDGGPAASATLAGPSQLQLDSAGNLYVATYGNIRRIATNGIITTVAGTSSATGMGFDKAGNLYFASQSNQTVSQINASGSIAVVAGNGQSGFSGDGGPAKGAGLGAPSDVIVDATGNLYIADRDNNRVRRVDPTGTISTLAGKGYSVADGGPATNGVLNSPWLLDVDPSGNLYIADPNSHRVRKVTPGGVISTFAGIGRAGFSGDGGQAASAALNYPSDVKVDASGNVFIADSGNGRIRKVTPAGIISTFAGGGPCCNYVDGVQATSTFMSYPDALALDGSGNMYVADPNPNTIRKINAAGIITTIAGNGQVGNSGDGGPATAATFGGSFSQILADSSGNLYVTEPRYSRVRKIDTNGIITAFAGTGNGGPSGDGGPATQATLTFPQGLAQDKAGNIYIVCGFSPIRIVKPNGIIQTYAGAGGPSGFSGDGGPSSAASFNIPHGAAIDSSGNLYIADEYNRRIRLIQAAIGPSILVSEKGLTYLAAAGAGAPGPQTFTVVNGGQGTLNWGAAASTTSGGNWLSLAPASGSSPAGGAGPPVQVSVNPAGLAAGDYYGQIQITANGAPNSPQSVTVVLHVGVTGSAAASLVQPSGLLFTMAAGGANPAAQSLTLSTTSNTSVSFTGTVSFGGQPWFTLQPATGTTIAGKPTTVQVTPTATGFAPGVYNGNITFAFSDNSLQSVQLLLVVSTTGGTLLSNGSRATGGPCNPTKLLPLFTSLGSGFSITTSWPTPVEVRVVDDCANALTKGSVVSSFSNGDSALTLTSLGDGRWTGTWQAQNASASVSVTASAKTADQALSGSSSVSGGLNLNANPPPAVAPGGVLNAASYSLQGSLAPGSLISVFGSLLAQQTAQAATLPLPTTLGQTTIIVAGRQLPLIYAGPNQVNAMIPFDLPINATHQVVVQRGATISIPQPIGVISSQSGIFTQDLSGQGEGIIVRVASDGTQSVVTPTNPAHVFDALVIYCAGLGDVNPRQIAGAATPFSPLSPTLEPVTVTIGGIDSPVIFAGLTPGLTGLYQINAYVPVGTAPGDNVPVVITQSGRTSPTVSISVR